MKKIIILLFLLMILASCSDDVTTPVEDKKVEDIADHLFACLNALEIPYEDESTEHTLEKETKFTYEISYNKPQQGDGVVTGPPIVDYYERITMTGKVEIKNHRVKDLGDEKK